MLGRVVNEGSSERGWQASGREWTGVDLVDGVDLQKLPALHFVHWVH
jgi:hypothetical protein